jgi:hypothetical protein
MSPAWLPFIRCRSKLLMLPRNAFCSIFHWRCGGSARVGRNCHSPVPGRTAHTPECIKAIEAQGWLGQLTTQNIGRVANETINAALAGRLVVIPGHCKSFPAVIGRDAAAPNACCLDWQPLEIGSPISGGCRCLAQHEIENKPGSLIM